MLGVCTKQLKKKDNNKVKAINYVDQKGFESLQQVYKLFGKQFTYE